MKTVKMKNTIRASILILSFIGVQGLFAGAPDVKDRPKSIIYVDSSATGRNDGTSWTDACTDFNAALKKITAEKNVIWLAGTSVCSADCVVTIPSGVKAKIRGGFKGGEVSASDRKDGAKSTVSGGVRKYKTLEVTSDSRLYIERVRFVDSRERGILKRGAGDLILADCDIVGCGFTLGNVYGRGFLMVGASGKTKFAAMRCTFAGNRAGGAKNQYDVGTGHGAALMNLARATFDDCLFATNGLSVLSSPAEDPRGFRFFKASALYATNAPVTVRGTRFVGNRGWCSQDKAPASDFGLMGATVRLDAGTGGSAFTNCLWLANQSAVYNVHQNFGGGGELWFNPCKPSAECDIVNCTFAANLNDVWRNGSRCVNVRSGKVKILNSVFGCNVRTRTGTDVGEDVYVADGAEVYAESSVFTPDKKDGRPLYAAGAGRLTLGEGVRFGKPEFVSRVDDARYMKVQRFRAHYYMPVALDYLMNFNVNLPGRAGYYDAGKPVRPRAGARRDKKVPVEDIIVCDGSDYSIRIYRGDKVVWRWCAAEDKTFADNEHNDLRGRYNGLTEVRICDYRGRKVVAISSTNCAWAIVDIATTNAIAYGYSRTAGQPVRNTIMPHSIAILPDDIVAVASTYTIDQNAPETKYGCYFYHIAGDKATSYKDPAKQGATFFSIENPHGFYWDDKNKKLYVSSSEGLTRLNVAFNRAENKFEIDEEAVFGISQLGAKWGHDLAIVPGTRILAMTTYEMTLFFDMDREEWLLDEIVWRMDIKGFDPHKDKTHVLATVPRSQYVTDTLEIWTREKGFKDYLKVPGAKFYKARWAGRALESAMSSR